MQISEFRKFQDSQAWAVKDVTEQGAMLQPQQAAELSSFSHVALTLELAGAKKLAVIKKRQASLR